MSSDDECPALPPDLIEAREKKKPVVLGPLLPPARSSPEPESSDEEIGPLPPPDLGQVVSDPVREFMEQEERQKERERAEEERKRKDKELKRDEWMLVPPKEMDMMRVVDPTKLKSRGFQHSTKVKESSSISREWTETPAERQKRIEDEVMGRVVKSSSQAAVKEETHEERLKRKRDRQLREEVDQYNKKSRSSTLLNEHSSEKRRDKKDKKEEDRPVIWDRERDMSVTGQPMDESKRSKLIKDSGNLGSRFGSGSFL